MKRVLTGSCLAAAFAVGLAAQTPSPSTPPQTTPQTPPSSASPSSQDRDAAKAITVTGCLKAGDSSDSFMLSDLKWGGKGSSTGAVGTSGSAPAAIGSATTLKIVPSGGAKLSEHVGHQVEITGTVADKAKSPSSTTPDPASPAGRPSSAPSSASSAPTFEARTVKMVSQTCSM
jgi:hypothetical protein